MMRGIQKLAEFDTKALLSGGAAGLGAYALTNSLTQDKILDMYAKTKTVPLVAGAVTALIVGVLVASRVKNKAQQPTVTPQHVQYLQQGFLPGEIVSFPSVSA
jgi:hypothetical protein